MADNGNFECNRADIFILMVHPSMNAHILFYSIGLDTWHGS